MFHRSVVRGSGSALPARVVTNQELSKEIETNDEWIVSRTGIRQRFWANNDELTSDLGATAAKKALDAAGILPQDVGLIVVGTTTPDTIFPSVGVLIQQKIGAHHAVAFDVQAACSGFVYALSVADNFLRVGQAKTALVIGAETMSRLLDPQDRTTRVLFGDGAGAVVLQAEPAEADPLTQRGIISTHLYSDGQYRDLLYVDNGPGQPTPGHGYMRMMGREVYRHAVEKIGQAVVAALAHNNLTIADIDWFVPHQANIRIIKGLCAHFGLPEEKVIVTIDQHANTSSASIPLALDIGTQDGRIQKNDMVLIEALGGGLTWGSAIIRW